LRGSGCAGRARKASLGFVELFLQFSDFISVSVPNVHDLVSAFFGGVISSTNEPFHETLMFAHPIRYLVFQPPDLL
jgi:hypothetical protein